jgi:hypothetical protein
MTVSAGPARAATLAALVSVAVLLVSASGARPARTVVLGPTIRELAGQRFVVAMKGSRPS